MGWCDSLSLGSIHLIYWNAMIHIWTVLIFDFRCTCVVKFYKSVLSIPDFFGQTLSFVTLATKCKCHFYIVHSFTICNLTSLFQASLKFMDFGTVNISQGSNKASCFLLKMAKCFPWDFYKNSSGGWCFLKKGPAAGGFEPSLSFMTFVDSSCILMVSFLKERSHCSPKKQ